MDGYIYYISLAVMAVIAIQFFRGGHLLLSAVVLAIGAWTVYNHDKNIDISETIFETIDEGAKSEYQKKGMETDLYNYDLNKAK